MTEPRRLRRSSVVAGSCLLAILLAGCDNGDDFDVSSQIGPDPVLPSPLVVAELQDALLDLG